MKQAAYRVTIDLTQAQTHRAKVQIHSLSENIPSTLEFPVWTPGSYLVREYCRHITCLEPAEKIAKNKWRLTSAAKTVSYEVYAFERTVRTSYLDPNYAVLVGASLLPLLYAPFELVILTPKKWTTVSSALPLKKKAPGKWITFVEDDDKWIDCPIILCAPGYGQSTTFHLKGIPHTITWVGQHPARSMAEMKAAFQKIATTTLQMFGGAPFKKYWFLLQFGHKLYGGLEHRDSQLSQYDGASLVEDKEWDHFLRLIAHEYFHSWNVKSLRPYALGPFHYFAENYTQDIWFAEGLTDYFDDMIPLKAGLIKEDAYWKARLKDAQIMNDGLPGHRRRSLAESSMDAWIRYYRPDEDSVNTDVSYYSKGALLGWCWDAHLRKKSKGKWTLEKLIKAFWKEFGIDAYEPLRLAKPGYTRDELFSFAEDLTGIPQRTVLEGWVTERRPLPWREAAKTFGLNVSENVIDPIAAQLGCVVQWKNGQAFIAKVFSGSAAEEAGIAPGDELIALENTRITDNEKLLATYKGLKQSQLSFHLARLDRLYTTSLKPRKHAGLGVEYKNV